MLIMEKPLLQQLLQSISPRKEKLLLKTTVILTNHLKKRPVVSLLTLQLLNTSPKLATTATLTAQATLITSKT